MIDRTVSTFVDYSNKTSLFQNHIEDSSENCDREHKIIAMDTLKQLLEKLTKKFNWTSSVNKNIRNDITSYRKERTLYDLVFKNLESLILQEEKKLLGIIMKNNDVAQQIKLADDNLSNIVETVGKFKEEDLATVISQEKDNYNNTMHKTTDFNKKCMQVKVQEIKAVEESEIITENKKSIVGVVPKIVGLRSSRFADKTPLESQNSDKNSPVSLINQNEQRVFLIEKLVKEFKYKTEENQISNLVGPTCPNLFAIEESYKLLADLEFEVISKVRVS